MTMITKKIPAIGKEPRTLVDEIQDQIPFRLVLATIAVDGYKPILGDKRSKTRWSVFIKS